MTGVCHGASPYLERNKHEQRNNAQHLLRETPDFVSKTKRNTYRVGALLRAPKCRDNATRLRNMLR